MFFKKDYFSNDYDEKTSKINLYYRKLIEDQQRKYERLLDEQKYSGVQFIEEEKKKLIIFKEEISKWKMMWEQEKNQRIFLEQKIEEIKREQQINIDSQIPREDVQHYQFLLSEKNKEVIELRREIENQLLRQREDKEKTLLKNQSHEKTDALIEFLKEKNDELQTQNIELNRKVLSLENQNFENQEKINWKEEFQKNQIDYERIKFQESQQKNEILFLKEQIQDLKQQLSIKEKPQVQRVVEQTQQIVYKENPYIQEKLNNAYQEIEKYLDEEQKMKKIQNEKQLQIEDLNNQLRNKEIDNFELQKQIEIIKKKNFINDEMELNQHREILINKNKLKDRVFQFSEKIHQNKIRESKLMIFLMLKENLAFQKLLKEKKQQENLVLVKQKFEIVDGTYQVFQDFKYKFENWIFKQFVESTDIAFKKKTNSFLLFKDKMTLLKSNSNYFNLIASFYFRLENLVLEELPQLKIIIYKENEFEEENHQKKAYLAEDINKMLENDDYIQEPKKNPKPKKKNLKTHEKNCIKFPKELKVEINEYKNFEEWIKQMLIKVVQKHKESTKTLCNKIQNKQSNNRIRKLRNK